MLPPQTVVPSLPAALPAAAWISRLWPMVCGRARRPVGGIALPVAAAGEVATAVFEEFLDAFPRAPGSWEAVQHWLTARVAPLALAKAAALRRREGDWQAARDETRVSWERNPNFDTLRRRGPGGELVSEEWTLVYPILWQRSVPVLRKLGISDEDARDVFSETMVELTAPRDDAGPLEKMLVFEELPRFYAMMVERRGITWLRKISAQKRAPTNPALGDSLDAPDSLLAMAMADPVSVAHAAARPWERVGFDRIYTACKAALTDFEWHLVEALFVEGSHTRLSLAGDPWVLGHLGLPVDASESKRRRRLNLFIESALSRLGAELENHDL